MNTKQKTLSIFPFYGGKARLAPLICDLLDYSTTSLYVEPFGGGARTLLNKRPHAYEIYNDGSRCLCAFMRVMANYDTAMELIDCLHDTMFSEEQFDKAVDVCSEVDISCYVNSLKKEDKQLKQEMPDSGIPLGGDKSFKKGEHIVNCGKVPLTSEDKKIERNAILADELELTPDAPAFSDIEIAAATFIMYTMSRDGMGTSFSSARFKTQAAYHKRIDRLLKVAERLEGVQVLNSDARFFFLENAALFVDPAVMAYCDPPYLSDREAKAYSEAAPQDLGVSYHYRMSAEGHETFLRQAVACGCKMLISNYDNELYNDYLHDWTRIEVPVTTSVGGKKNNKRTEVLWYNY